MHKVISKDGTEIAYDLHGSGPLLICVAGATQHRAVDQEGTPALARLLSPHFTVLIHDRRGRGDSTDTAPYAVQREVDDIAALIEAHGGRADLFGMSSGAVLAVEAAAPSARWSPVLCSTSRRLTLPEAPPTIRTTTRTWPNSPGRARPRK